LKKWYKDFAFRPETLRLIGICNDVIEQYEAQGFQLTLRQLYYQLVSRDIIPNQQTEYKRLGSIVNDARLAGMIDWETIEDRTRNLESLAEWNEPSDIVSTCARQFHVDLWAGQPKRPEVWIEKDALLGVIEPVCHELDVDFFSCRGYTSQSEMWRASVRLLDYIQNDQQPVILHFGDHDPSGKDMSRDIEDRLELFIAEEAGGPDCFELHRIALNMDQVRKYKPPPNPAKFTDSRCTGYVKQFGTKSWELDALEPAVIAALIRANVEAVMDSNKFAKQIEKRTAGRALLTKISEKWDDVVRSL
jgi:hypothetical protein